MISSPRRNGISSQFPSNVTFSELFSSSTPELRDDPAAVGLIRDSPPRGLRPGRTITGRRAGESRDSIVRVHHRTSSRSISGTIGFTMHPARTPLPEILMITMRSSNRKPPSNEYTWPVEYHIISPLSPISYPATSHSPHPQHPDTFSSEQPAEFSHCMQCSF